jgi:hypothetical protein
MKYNSDVTTKNKDQYFKLFQRWFWIIWERQNSQTEEYPSYYVPVNSSPLSSHCGEPDHGGVSNDVICETAKSLTEVVDRWFAVNQQNNLDIYLNSFMYSLESVVTEDKASLLFAPYSFYGSSLLHWDYVKTCCDFLSSKRQRNILRHVINNVIGAVYDHTGEFIDETPSAIAECIFGIIATTEWESEFERLEEKSK